MKITRKKLFVTFTGLVAGLVMFTATAGQETVQTSSKPYGIEISAEMPYAKKRVDVLDSQMTYVDVGQGPTVVFLHGNPTSSYLWRNVIPPVVSEGYRAIAPDLIGMGDSDKPDIEYTFQDHYAYLSTFLDALDSDSMTLVIHDWGSALGMRYARENPKRVNALAYMEAIVAPGMPVPSLEAMGPEIGGLFGALRSPAGIDMVLGNNFFVEEVLPKFGVARTLSEAEMAAYRAPYKTRESRLPTLVWPRQIPINGEPINVVAHIEKNSSWLVKSPIPKLLFWAEPGSLMPKAAVDWHIANVPNLETRFLGAGLHFLQEDHPQLIGSGLSDWLRRIDLGEAQ